MTNKAQQDLLNQLNEYRQTQQLDEIPGKFGQAMKQVTRDLGGVAYDSIEGDGYDYRQGVRSHSDPIKTPNATGTQTPAAGAQTGTPAAGATGKRTKTGGRQKGGLSNTASAQKQRDTRAKKRSGIKTGIDQATATGSGPTKTNVPGQKGYIKPTTQMMPTGVLGPDGKDNQSGKPIAPAGKRPTISGIKPEDPRYPALYKAYMNKMNKTV